MLYLPTLYVYWSYSANVNKFTATAKLSEKSDTIVIIIVFDCVPVYTDTVSFWRPTWIRWQKNLLDPWLNNTEVYSTQNYTITGRQKNNISNENRFVCSTFIFYLYNTFVMFHFKYGIIIEFLIKKLFFFPTHSVLSRFRWRLFDVCG